MAHFYSFKVVQSEGGKGGAEGRVGVLSEPENDNFPAITVQSPAEFKGPKDESGRSLYWTPEHLYVASVGVCYFTTFVAIAENSHLKYSAFSVEGKGKLEKVSDVGMMITEINLKINVKVPDNANKKKAMRVLEKTEKNCLISNSMKTEVKAEFNVEISEN